MTTRATRGITRGTVAALLTVPATSLMLVGAPLALAAGGTFLSPTPANDASIDSGTAVGAQAQISRGTGSTTLRLVGPGVDTNATWSCPSSLTNSTPCKSTALNASLAPGGTPRANGKWTVSLTDGNQVRVFYTNLPPSTPGSLSAQGTGANRVDLSWSYDGNEPDLTGFVISDDKGNTFPVSDPSARSYTALYEPNPTPGTYDYSFTVKALRKNGKGDGTVAGSSSSAASAQLVTPQPPPPPPSPTATPAPGGGGSTPPPGGGGSTPGTGGGSTGGGSTGGGSTGGGSTGGSSGGSKTDKPVIAVPTLNPIVQQRRSYALSFNRFSPSLGIPKLPPLPATTFKTTEGTFAPTLPYEEQSQEQDQPGNLLADPLGTVTSLDAEQLAKNIAIALVLLVAGAHIRLFLAGNRE